MVNNNSPTIAKIKAMKASAIVSYLNSIGATKCELCNHVNFSLDTVGDNLEAPLLMEVPVHQLPGKVVLYFTIYCKKCGNSKFLRADILNASQEQETK